MTFATTTYALCVALFFTVGCGSDSANADGGGESGAGTNGPPSGCMRVKASSGSPPAGEEGMTCSYTVLGCPDEHSYGVACESTSDDGPLTCQCKIDDESEGDSFEFDDGCPRDADDLRAMCGWD